MQVIKIGRNQDNDIIFSDQTVSGSHVDIYINDDGSLQIVDHSSNGTYVNQTFLHGSAMPLTGNETLTFPGQNVIAMPQLLSHYNIQRPHQATIIQPAQQQIPHVDSQQPTNVNVNLQFGHQGHNIEQRATPKCYNRWSWGGFAFGWLWGVFNRVYWPLIIFIPLLGQLAALIIAFILGANGNRYAWEKYDGSAEEFDKKQHRWTVAALICFGISLLGVIITIITIVSAGAAFMNSMY